MSKIIAELLIQSIHKLFLLESFRESASFFVKFSSLLSDIIFRELLWNFMIFPPTSVNNYDYFSLGSFYSKCFQIL